MSNSDPRQQGMPWMSPYLMVQDVPKALDFYGAAFGFVKGETIPDESGKIYHAECRYHDMVIMMGWEACEAAEASSPATTSVRSPIGMYTYVKDVDTFAEKAVAAGATLECEPNDTFWGDRICSLKDIDGYSWTFATKLEQE